MKDDLAFLVLVTCRVFSCRWWKQFLSSTEKLNWDLTLVEKSSMYCYSSVLQVHIQKPTNWISSDQLFVSQHAVLIALIYYFKALICWLLSGQSEQTRDMKVTFMLKHVTRKRQGFIFCSCSFNLINSVRTPASTSCPSLHLLLHYITPHVFLP